MTLLPFSRTIYYGFGYAVVGLDPALYLGYKYAQHNEEKFFSVQRRRERKEAGRPTTWQKARPKPKRYL